jgi:hypothetical protein
MPDAVRDVQATQAVAERHCHEERYPRTPLEEGLRSLVHALEF